MAIFEGSQLSSEHGVALLSRLNQLHVKNMFVDACIVYKDVEIFAHKTVLAAASSLFCKRLSESEGNPARLNLEQDLQEIDITAEDIKLLINFIYSGQLSVSQARQALFFRLGTLLEIVGFPRPLNNTNYQAQFPQTISSNYNFNQHVFSPFSTHESPMHYEDLNNIQGDIFAPAFTPTCNMSPVLCPEKSDNTIKPDNSVHVAVVSNSIDDLGTGSIPLEFPDINERLVEYSTEELNPKFIDYQNLPSNYTNEVEDSSHFQYPSTFPSNANLIINEQEKDILNLDATLPVANAQSENFMHSLSSLPFTIPVLTSDIQTEFLSYSDEHTPLDLNFHNCKISGSHNIPERHARLKVKDSIGGVSLQDTSQGEKNYGLPSEIVIECVNYPTPEILQPEDDNSGVSLTRSNDLDVDPPDLGDDESQETKCPKCCEPFSSVEDLSVHMWNIHHIGTLFKCKLCDFETASESYLVQHGYSHMNNSDHICCICGKKCKTRATLRSHLCCHASDKWFKCRECKAHYSQRYNLLKHMASQHRLKEDHSPILEPFACSICSFTSFAFHKVEQHNIRCHTEDKAYKCEHCDYAATEKSSLVKHTRVHTQERPYVCHTCGIRFVTVSALNRHFRTHTKEKPFKCDQCGKQYADHKRLREHLLKHRSIKPFKCSSCSYSCRRRDHLKSHVRRAHPTETPENVQVILPTP